MSLKRGLDDEEIVDIAPTPKRVRLHSLSVEAGNNASPSKKRKLEQEGLVLVDSAQDELVDSVIVID